MSPTQKAPTKPRTASRAPQHAHARYQEHDRVIRRISDSLEVAQADLGKLRGSLGTGVGDLRRNLARLLRDARRDTEKMRKATRRDLERLQKDMLAAAKAKPGRSATAKSRSAAAKPRSATGKSRASATKAR